MKIFLKKILYFLIILIGINFILAYFAKKVYFRDYGKRTEGCSLLESFRGVDGTGAKLPPLQRRS